jgi:hypothetical protein
MLSAPSGEAANAAGMLSKIAAAEKLTVGELLERTYSGKQGLDDIAERAEAEKWQAQAQAQVQKPWLERLHPTLLVAVCAGAAIGAAFMLESRTSLDRIVVIALLGVMASFKAFGLFSRQTLLAVTLLVVAGNLSDRLLDAEKAAHVVVVEPHMPTRSEGTLSYGLPR